MNYFLMNQHGRKKIIIGLAGKIASGKETVSKYFVEKYNAKKMRFSDPLRQILDIIDLPNSRENVQTLSTLLREKFGEDILSMAIVKLVNRTENNLTIIDGVRRFSDIANFKKIKKFFLIYIDVKQDKRYERSIKRNENYCGDSKMSREEFNKKDEAEAEIQIESLKRKADFLIDNNETLKDTYTQIENIFKKINNIT